MNHKEWVQHQFGGNNWDIDRYRNALIHASLLESVVRKFSGEKEFGKALKKLLETKQLSTEEFNAIDKVRDLRNELVHDIFAKQLDERLIIGRVKNLMSLIKEQYASSSFLKKTILQSYEIHL